MVWYVALCAALSDCPTDLRFQEIWLTMLFLDCCKYFKLIQFQKSTHTEPHFSTKLWMSGSALVLCCLNLSLECSQDLQDRDCIFHGSKYLPFIAPHDAFISGVSLKIHHCKQSALNAESNLPKGKKKFIKFSELN